MRISEQILLNTEIYKNSINLQAVYSDESENYIQPFEPDFDDEVKVRIRIGSGEADYIAVVSDGAEYEMLFEKNIGIYDFYFYLFAPESENRRYSFKIKNGDKIVYYNKYGLMQSLNTDGDFEIKRDYKTPSWAKSAVGYQIFVDRFCNGDISNDVVDGEYEYLGHSVKHISDWSKTPEESDVFNFYGGDLQGVIDKLDYLKELGITMIYFNPLFVSPSNHKYDIQDYEHIDPHFGKIVKDSEEDKYAVRTISEENITESDKLFVKLVEKAHSMGIKVIIDGVFNHCGAFHKWLDREGIYEKLTGAKGAYKNSDSPYRDYFVWNENGEYEGWWGHYNHPKLNYENSPELYEYIMKIGERWLKPPFNADGWRMDVAADLGGSAKFNHKFWKDFRKRVKEVSPNAVIIAEHYGDAYDWLKGDEWDTIMNYDAFMEPVSWFFTGMEKHSDSYNGELISNGKSFESAMTHNYLKYGSHAMNISMNELSNHDHSRFLTRTNSKVGRLTSLGAEAAGEGINIGRMFEAAVFQFVWVGMPTIYYGEEVGVVGWTDPDNRRTYPWGKENLYMLDFYRRLVDIRKNHSVFTDGSCRFIHSDYGTVSVARFTDKKCVIAVFNNTDNEMLVHVPAWLACAESKNGFVSLMEGSDGKFDVAEKDYAADNGYLDIHIGKYGFAVIKNK